MPIEVILPKVDMDMSSGTIAGWYKAEGEIVAQGEALFDIETDKATMEVESPGTGTLHFVSAKKGDIVPIGQTVGWIFSKGEQVVSPAGSGSNDSQFNTIAETAPAIEIPNVEKTKTASLNAGGKRASPLARRV
ncbi:MAG: biotin/lipoyl-containing protein, partial [Rhodobacterales bacterium]